MSMNNVDFSFEEVNREKEGVIRLPAMHGKGFSSEVTAYESETTYGKEGQWLNRFSHYLFTDIEPAIDGYEGLTLVIEAQIENDKRTHLIYLTDGEKVISSKIPKRKPLDVLDETLVKACKKEFYPTLSHGQTEGLLQDVRLYISNDTEGTFKETLIQDNDTGLEDIDSDFLLRCRGYDVTEKDSDVIRFKEKIRRENDSNVIQFLQEQIPNLILDETSNIMKKVLMGFSTMLGKASYFDITLGDAQEGKSLMIETTLKYFIPREYQENFNEVTDAYFINKAMNDPHCYDRKIINLGDLGSEDKFQKMAGVFDILKILCTEKFYDSGKSTKGENDWEASKVNLKADSICISYSSVRDSKTSNTEQIESRAITSTPNHEKSILTFSFNNRQDVFGTKENALFQRTVDNLRLFQKYLLYLTNKCYHLSQDIEEDGVLIHQRIEVYNIFEKLFYTLGASKDVGIRNAGLLSKLLTSFTILNWDKAHRFVKEIPVNEEEMHRITYLFPRIDDILSFIDIVSDSAGVSPRVKELIKALCDNFIIIDEEIEDPPKKVEDKPLLPYVEKAKSVNARKISKALLKNKEEGELETRLSLVNLAENTLEYDPHIYRHMTLESVFQRNGDLLSQFYDQYGLTNKSRRHNKSITKKLQKTEDEIEILELYEEFDPLIFFTVTHLRRHLQVKGIKGINDLAELLNDAYKGGYVDKFTQKNRANVYYLTHKARTLTEPTHLTQEHIKDAIKNLDNLKTKPLDRKSSTILSEEEKKQVKDDYESIFEDK